MTRSSPRLTVFTRAVPSLSNTRTRWRRFGTTVRSIPPCPRFQTDSQAEAPAGFAMPRSEAAWLRDRMLASSPDTMLEYALQHRPDADSAFPWEDSVLMSADGERTKVLHDARRFSVCMNSASLVYNLLLAEAYEREGFDRVENPVDDYRARLDQWAERPGLADDIATWDRGAFWHRVLEQESRRQPPITPLHRHVARSASRC